MAGYRDPRYSNISQGKYVLSPSMIDLSRRCGVAFFRKMTEEYPTIRRRMAIGSGISMGAKLDNCSKRDRDTPAARQDIIDQSVATYEEECERAQIMEDAKFPANKAKDHCRWAAETYADVVSPTIRRVAMSEQKLVFPIAPGVELAGTPDLVTAIDDGFVQPIGVGDYKTGKDPWSQKKANATLQLTAYMLLYYRQYGEWPPHLWIDSLSQYYKTYRHTRIFTYRTAADITALKRSTMMCVKSIESGVFMPASPLGWWCSQDHCEYWETCEFATKGVTVT